MAGKKSPDDWFAEARPFSAGLLNLRELALGAGLTETLKWGQPTYTYEDRNIVGIGAFKSYFGIWFFEGARLADKNGVLTNAQPGKTQSMRQWRFAEAADIMPTLIKRYLKEAITLPPETRKPARTSRPVVLPEELKDAFVKDTPLKKAFSDLSAACQWEYAEYVAEAKKPETRTRRLGKITPMILGGVGLHDKYR